jgi:sugar O-acyltransferase (sialic acid O-acetyltransferase NeuD family)
MKNEKIVIIGAGETAQIACEYFEVDSNYEVVAFSVDRQYIKNTEIMGRPVIPFEDLELNYPPEKYSAFVAVSSTNLNRVRKVLYDKTKEKGYKLVSYVSSKAFVWRNVPIGDNCFIFEDNTIQPFVTIGSNVVLWSGNHIGHNSEIGNNCFIASHVVVSGYCSIGENTFMGVNSTVINNIKVGKDCFIGAGALIQKDIDDAAVVQESSTDISKVNTYRLFKVKP